MSDDNVKELEISVESITGDNKTSAAQAEATPAEATPAEATPAEATPAEATAATACAVATHLFVLSDGYGFVGAFFDIPSVQKVVDKYVNSNFICNKYNINPAHSIEHVWVIIYRDVDIVAYVSNSREDALAVYKMYDALGLMYPDDIDFWRQPTGVVAPHAEHRLEIHHKAMESDADPVILENLLKLEKLLNLQVNNGPVAEAKTPIFDYVVPIQLNENVGSDADKKAVTDSMFNGDFGDIFRKDVQFPESFDEDMSKMSKDFEKIKEALGKMSATVDAAEAASAATTNAAAAAAAASAATTTAEASTDELAPDEEEIICDAAPDETLK